MDRLEFNGTASQNGFVGNAPMCKREEPPAANSQDFLTRVQGTPTGLEQFWKVASTQTSPFFERSFQFQCSQIPSIRCSGIFPVRDKSEARIALLPNGEDSFSARMEALKSAKKSIRIQALLFTGDESGLAIAEILKRKKRDGLDVRVIVDAASTAIDWQTQWMLYDLKQNGIEVEGYEALWLQWINEFSIKDPMNVNRRFHEKLWIIDGEEKDGIAIVGGLNIANEYFRVGSRPKDRWRDQDLAVKGAIVKDLVATFDRNYQYFKGVKTGHPDIFNTDKYWKEWRGQIVGRFGLLPVAFKTDDKITAKVKQLANRSVLNGLKFMGATARFVQNRPRYEESFILQAYLSLIESAHERIEIANAYFIPKRVIREALIRARARGVKVTILTNSKETNDLPQMTVVGRYFYKGLIAAGIDIHEWQGHKQGEGTLHAKYAIFDNRTAIVGSYNLDPRSELHNSESIITFEERELASGLSGLFAKDLQKSRKIGKGEADKFSLPKNPWEKMELSVSLWFQDWV
ncbi:MAG: phosphatidylserine/phosphatidylglycerophosphate/cardiolipin synthase family protein [Deltaproteobacteria bacterium]|nr:phosphatidylserine/phosphatidylglycerophosphate/cardiolipin synthase family protein [Deltaproteobacteria bacterium]